MYIYIYMCILRYGSMLKTLGDHKQVYTCAFYWPTKN